MSLPYQDNPIPLEQWLEKLGDRERALFDRGYTAALEGLLETFVDTKRTLLDKTLILDDEDDLKRQLLSRVYILDVLEKRYRKRVTVLSPQIESL